MNICLSVKKAPDLRHGFLTLPRFSLLCHGRNSYSNTKAEGVGFGQQHESLRLTLSQGPVLHLLKLQLKPTLQRTRALCMLTRWPHGLCTASLSPSLSAMRQAPSPRDLGLTTLALKC